MCSATQAQHEAVSKSTRAPLQIAIFVLPTVVLAGWVTGATFAQWQTPFDFFERSSQCHKRLVLTLSRMLLARVCLSHQYVLDYRQDVHAGPGPSVRRHPHPLR